MSRYIIRCSLVFCLWPAMLVGQDGTPPTPNGSGSSFATSLTFQTGNNPSSGASSTTLLQGEVIYPPLQNGFNLQQSMPQMQERAVTPPAPEKSALERLYKDDLFHYTWIDFGSDPGLRIHRIEMTNAWADMRAANFFSRPIEETNHHFDAGLSFSVQWWKELTTPAPWPNGPYLPPVLYDLYIDFGWRTAINSAWLIDLAVSPGWSTDFRVTPPDGFRMKGHAITMVDMLPNLRGVLGIWYVNRSSTKILPVAGFSWQASDATRIEAIFPQPRLVHSLGCWKGSTWEVSVGGEFGGGSWAFKNPENDRETIDYRDIRVLLGLGCNGKHGQVTLQAGYVFSRELQYGGIEQGYDFNPGNAWMIRLGWDY